MLTNGSQSDGYTARKNGDAPPATVAAKLVDRQDYRLSDQAVAVAAERGVWSINTCL